MNEKTPPRRLVFAIVAIALFMGSVDLTIVATALPAIHRGLRASINWVGWTITIYGLAMVVALPIAGKFSIQFGRRRVFLYGIVLFTAASLLCGFATDIYVLIFFRALQAIGGGALQPSAAGLIADHFGKDRDRGIGMFGAVSSGGQIVGPIFGGLLVGYLSWRWIFFVNVPIGVVLVALTVRYIPESRGQAAEKTDFVGLVADGLDRAGGDLRHHQPRKRSHADLRPDLPRARTVRGRLLVDVRAAHPKCRCAVHPGAPPRRERFRGHELGEPPSWHSHVRHRFARPSLCGAAVSPRRASAGTLLTARAVGMIAVGTVAAFTLRRTGYRLPMMLGFSVVALGTLLMSVSPRWGVSPVCLAELLGGHRRPGPRSGQPGCEQCLLAARPRPSGRDHRLTRHVHQPRRDLLGIGHDGDTQPELDPRLTQAHVFWAAAAVVFSSWSPRAVACPEHKGGW